MTGQTFETSHAANPANVANRGTHASRNSHDSQHSQPLPLPAAVRHSHDSQHSHALGAFRVAWEPTPHADVVRIDFAAGRGNGLCRLLRALVRPQRMAAVCVSDGWTHGTAGAGCGPVLLLPGAPHTVIACPRCRHRKAGRTIPRPAGRLST